MRENNWRIKSELREERKRRWRETKATLEQRWTINAHLSGHYWMRVGGSSSREKMARRCARMCIPLDVWGPDGNPSPDPPTAWAIDVYRGACTGIMGGQQYHLPLWSLLSSCLSTLISASGLACILQYYNFIIAIVVFFSVIVFHFFSCSPSFLFWFEWTLELHWQTWLLNLQRLTLGGYYLMTAASYSRCFKINREPLE